MNRGLWVLGVVGCMTGMVFGQSPNFEVIAPPFISPATQGEFRIIIAGPANSDCQGGIYSEVCPLRTEVFPAAGNLGNYTCFPKYCGCDFIVGDIMGQGVSEGVWFIFTYQTGHGPIMQFDIYDYAISPFGQPVDTIRIDSVPVEIDPQIVVSPKTITISATAGGANPKPQSLRIRNWIDSTFDWQIVEDCPWLVVSPANGNTDIVPEYVEVSVDITGMAPGSYEYPLTIVVPGAVNSPVVVPVKLVLSGCYTGPDLAEWISVGWPQSWCAPRQCHGDANNSKDPYGKCYYWVGYRDINILLAGFSKPYYGDPIAQPWIAADFDHRTEKIGKGSYRVGYNDINVLLRYFAKPDSGIWADCQTANPVRP
jgi:hypothetical protein